MRFTGALLDPQGSMLDAKVAVALENQVLRKVDKVICPSRYMRDWFVSTYAFRGVVEVVPNLIDFSTVDSIKTQTLHRELGLSKGTPIIYMPSAATQIKGGVYLTTIVAELLQAQKFGIYLPGYIDPELKPEVRQLYKKAPIYSPGHISYEKHIAIVKTCLFGISPAVMENFSMAILEAVYLGVPMIVFRAGGNEDLVVQGKNGFLVPAYNVHKMVNKAASLLELKSVAEFKLATKEYTRNKFSTHSILNKYLKAMEVV